MDGAARDEHRGAVVRASAEVLDPTLVIWLDAPVDQLLVRVAARGREFESPVDHSFLAALRAGYIRVLSAPDAPPLYRPEATTMDSLRDEVLLIAAAIAG